MFRGQESIKGGKVTSKCQLNIMINKKDEDILKWFKEQVGDLKGI